MGQYHWPNAYVFTAPEEERGRVRKIFVFILAKAFLKLTKCIYP